LFRDSAFFMCYDLFEMDKNTYKAIKKYTEAPKDPISLIKGDCVQVLKDSDPSGDWPNWVLCHGNDQEGWVPKQILDLNGNMAVVSENYTAREMNLSIGEIILGSSELNGWVWAVKKEEPEISGWAPLNCLERFEI